MVIHPARSSSATLVLGALLLASCAGDHPLTGTWHDPTGTTALPQVVGGGTLDIDATLVLDGRATPSPTFDLRMDLATQGLADVIDAQGTYVVEGGNLSLTFTGFVIDPASGNAPTINGATACITQQGFGGASVCFPTPQSHAYVLDGDTLTMTIDNSIAGAVAAPTTLHFTRVR